MDEASLDTLIARSRDGDLEAFSQIVRALHGEVRGFAAMMAVEPDWIDDVAQEIFLEAYRSLHRFAPERSFRKWVRGVARNVIRRHAERLSRESKLRQDATSELLRRRQEQLDRTAAEPEAAQAGALDALRRCLGRLPEHLRRLLDQRYSDQKSSGEIGRALGRTADAVRVSLMRTRRQLLECMHAELSGS